MTDDEPEDADPAPSTDDLLEAARQGIDTARPDGMPRTIGSQQIVRAEPTTPPEMGNRRRACVTCGALVGPQVAGCVLRRDCHLVPLSDGEWTHLGTEYHDTLTAAIAKTRLDKWMEWGPNTWRPIPGFPHYSMNGYSREVRREAYEAMAKNGVARRYPARPVSAIRSSVTISQNGQASSHGIEKLWRLTFPEYVVADEPGRWNDVHTLRREDVPAELGRVIQKP